MHHTADIAIIGAGAAGLAAGIFAGESNPKLNIVILDGAKTIGAKILVSGGGRCNVTNGEVTPSDFHAPKRIVARILKRFTEEDTVRWLTSLGVDLKQEDTGKIFPVSNRARTILSALVQRCQALGIHIRTQQRVHQIHPQDGRYRILHDQGDLFANRIIMATGGQSLPKTGSDGQGWTLVRHLGHTITPPFPALVPLLLEKTFVHQKLSGISHETRLTTRIDHKVIDQRCGSLLWTHFGISGPVVLDASRFWVIGTQQKRAVSLTLSCLPGHTLEEADRWLIDSARAHPQRTVETVLSPTVPHRVISALCDGRSTREAEREQTSPLRLNHMRMGQVSRRQRREIASLLTELPLPIVADRGWNFAEVTGGGVPLDEINPQSMASRISPGLYLIGEMLDCDGRIGGFNFQWAWSTGYIAGISAARKCAPTSL